MRYDTRNTISIIGLALPIRNGVIESVFRIAITESGLALLNRCFGLALLNRDYRLPIGVIYYGM